MPASRLSMRKVYDVLRLHHEAGLSKRQVARCLSISHSIVRDYLRRAEAAGLSWPLPEDLDESALERLLFPPPAPASAHRPLPDWPEVHRQMRRKGVTLQLLWQEYKRAHPDGYQYSRFCELYRAWQGTLDLVMRHDHQAGEKLFVDYAGQTAELTDPETGEVRPRPARCARRRSSSPSSALPTTPMPRPPSRRRCRTGLALMCAPSPSSRART